MIFWQSGTEKIRFDAVSADRKRVAFRVIMFQREGFRSFKELIERMAFKAPDQEIKPLRITGKSLKTGRGQRVSFKGDAAVHHFRPPVAEMIDLFVEKAFQAEQAGGNIKHLFLPAAVSRRC